MLSLLVLCDCSVQRRLRKLQAGLGLSQSFGLCQFCGSRSIYLIYRYKLLCEQWFKTMQIVARIGPFRTLAVDRAR